MPLHIGSWLSGRYTPIHIYGPSGPTPELGTKAFVEGMKKGYAWDIATRTGALPDAGADERSVTALQPGSSACKTGEDGLRGVKIV